ncbi:MAG TPA: antitoxin Xre-like helix-turn-helix domain-containing protein, partial [Allosphingosinicella sp.]|nr:antitoxin Xre-like helix-turn-helix domain-containing protein [Allosphingosinicella sp.]
MALAIHEIDTVPRPFTPEPVTEEEAAAMFRAVINLFSKWGVSDEQASTLLDIPIRSLRRWRSARQPGR